MPGGAGFGTLEPIVQYQPNGQLSVPPGEVTLLPQNGKTSAPGRPAGAGRRQQRCAAVRLASSVQ